MSTRLGCGSTQSPVEGHGQARVRLVLSWISDEEAAEVRRVGWRVVEIIERREPADPSQLEGRQLTCFEQTAGPLRDRTSPLQKADINVGSVKRPRADKRAWSQCHVRSVIGWRTARGWY
jgi:hypothetical protein